MRTRCGILATGARNGGTGNSCAVRPAGDRDVVRL